MGWDNFVWVFWLGNIIYLVVCVDFIDDRVFDGVVEDDVLICSVIFWSE